ncbi:MAG: glycosyltransferase family protein [Candidatus Micrarchaeota archaeon]
MKILISSCGEGFGHTSRAVALQRAFSAKEHEVTVACYGSALERLRSFGIKTIETFPEAKMVGSKGSFNLARSFLQTSSTSPDFLRAYLIERQFITSNKIDAVISDSRFSPLIASYRLQLPAFYLTNQTSFYEFQNNHDQIIKKEETLLQRLSPTKLARSLRSKANVSHLISQVINVPLSTPFSFCDEILIPDFKPPDTICLPILSRRYSTRKKTNFMGPISILSSSQETSSPSWRAQSPRVLVTMGGQAYRSGLFEKLISISRKTRNFDILISALFAKKNEDYRNVKIRKYIPDLLPYMARADILVIPAGHSSIMESIILAKPALIIPDANQPEQLSNAKRFVELGLGESLQISELEKFPEKLKNISDNYSRYRRNLARLSEQAKNGQNGAKNTVRFVEEFKARTEY